MTTGYFGRNSLPTDRPETVFITFSEFQSITLPKTTLLPSNQGQGPQVILNKLPLLFLTPWFIIDRRPASLCLSSKDQSSNNVSSPQMLILGLQLTPLVTKSPPSMNLSSTILWRQVSLQPAGLPFHRDSPVQNCLKFSAVLGQISAKSSKVTLPILCLLACKSKNTTGFSLALMSPAMFLLQNPRSNLQMVLLVTSKRESGRVRTSSLSIIIFLPLVLPHLLDVLVLVIVLRPSLLELLLLPIFGLLVLVLHIVVFAVSLPKFLQFLLELGIEFGDVHAFVAVGGAVLLGPCETRLERQLLLALDLGFHFLVIALSGGGGTSELARQGVLGSSIFWKVPRCFSVSFSFSSSHWTCLWPWCFYSYIIIF